MDISGKEILEFIISRQSERGYHDKKVEDDKLGRILEAGRMAPSACNSQPWRFIVVDEPGIRREVAKAAMAKELGFNKFIDQAPLLLVVVREKGKVISRVGGTIKDKDYSLIDIGIAVENICLQAYAEGLGTCIVGWFNEKKVKELLAIPASRRAELIITLGYPAGKQRPKRRKEADEVISYNKY
ncbi:MAG: nitroreductase family protein [Bacteroidales bacterium]|jgi:nitroreductase|nr:nitroreductase family protein [Bacteroidales bacterium]